MEAKYLFAGAGIIIVLIYAFGSGIWVSSSPGWYSSLNRPPWQPPSYVFGIIWPYNFIVLGIAAVTIAQRATTTTTLIYLSFFALSVACALIWAYQFYRPHNLEFAVFALFGTALLTLPMLVIAFRTSIPIGIALVPYQVWVATAATLSYQYSKLN